jgi:hypothetical protein
MGAELLQTDGQTVLTKLTVAFHDFANAPKTEISSSLNSFSL